MVLKKGAPGWFTLFLSFIRAQRLCKLALNSFDAMAYTIISQPQSLSLSGNMPDIILSANAQVSFKLLLGSSVILDEAYSPDANSQIRIRIKEVVEQHLAVAIPISNVFEQAEAVKAFTANIDGTVYTYTVVKGGVDADSVDATAFCTQNWLTWQPQSKAVKLNDPQWLSYYAAQPTTVKAKGFKADGTSQDITLATLAAGKMYTINVQYAHLLSLFTNAPSYVDIWAESASAVRLSYIQRLVLNNDYDEFDDIFVFENSLGGIDTIRMIGSLQSVNESTSLSALFDEDTIEYDAEINKYYNKSTGYYPSESYRVWIEEFFTSSNRYHVRKGSIKRIVVKKSDVKGTLGDLNSASFTFAYTKQTKRLNLSRTETLPEVLEFVDPAGALFFLAPRLSEFKQHTPDDASIFPVQSPYAAEWQKMSLFDLLTYFSTKFGISAGGGGGHVHPDVAMLNKLKVVEQYLLFVGEKIKAGYADRTGECDNAKKWDDHNFGDYLDQSVRKTDTVTHKSVISDDWDDATDFGGDGFGLLPGGVAKFNHLTVRKSMSVFELIVKKLQAVGGMLVLSPGSGKVKHVEALADRYRITLEDADGEAAITFAADDLVKCQNFGSKTSKYYWRRCIEKGATYIDLSKDDCDTGSGIPDVGDELVQMGNATVTARQNIIIIDATDKPKISFYKGVNSYSLAGKERTRLGDLSELGIEDMGISTEAGRFSGKVVIGAGSTGLDQLSEWANKQSQIDGATSTAAAASATAAAAATAANTAKADAEDANRAIADMASDGKLSPVEKQSYKVIFDGYTSEKAKYDAQSDQFSVSRTAYDAAYDALNAYLTPLLADLTTTSDIVSANFTSTLKSYTDARTDLTNAIAAKTKALADNAQAKVDGLKIGGVNLFDNSSIERSGSNEYLGIDITNIAKDYIGQQVMISFDLKVSKTGYVDIYTLGGYCIWDGHKPINATTDYKRVFMPVGLFTYKPNDPNGDICLLSIYGLYGTGVIPTIRNIMVEKGNVASEFRLSKNDLSADAQSKADAAQEAAQTYATSQAAYEREVAKAHADGKVTAEEQARINQAAQNLEVAKNDAQTKSDAAKAAAIVAAAADAQAKVDAIKVGGVNLLDRSSKEKGGAEYLEYANLVSIFDKYGLGQYVISFDLKASKEGSVNCYSSPGASSDFKYLWDAKGLAATTSYKRYSVVINVVNSNSASVWSPLSFYSGYGSGVNFWVRDVMVERGNTASAYDISQFDKSIGNLFLNSAIERTYGNRFYEIKTADILLNYVGEVVTISMEVKSSETAALRVYPYQNSGITVDYTNSYNIGTSYERISFTGRVVGWSVPSGYTAGGIGLYLPNNPTGVVYVKNIQVSLGYSDLVYKENIADTVARITASDYLKTALAQQTTTEGGLLLTSLIQLGLWNSGAFTGKAGINGTAKSPADVIAWFGGTLTEALQNLASIVFRLDGSGQLAKGGIKWWNDGSGHVANGNIAWNPDGSGTLAGGLIQWLISAGQVSLRMKGQIATPFKEIPEGLNMSLLTPVQNISCTFTRNGGYQPRVSGYVDYSDVPKIRFTNAPDDGTLVYYMFKRVNFPRSIFEDRISSSASFHVGVYENTTSDGFLSIALGNDNGYVSGSIMWVASLNQWVKMSEVEGLL